MPEANTGRCRLCLVTPADRNPNFVGALEEALAGGDVASLIVTSAADWQGLSETLAAAAQARGVAVLVHNDFELVGRVAADGVLVDNGIGELRAAVAAMRPKKFVGAGGLGSRHQAMAAGEVDPDFLFFGRPDGDTADAIFPKALDLAAWWASLFVIPAMVMGGASIASVGPAAEADIEFVALRRAVWEHPDGPGAAVAEANRWLTAAGKAVA